MVRDGSDTIFALASGAGRAAIAIFRITGPASGSILDAICRTDRPVARRASVRRLWDGGGQVLDRALVLWLPGPSTYSGEDSAELHVHAGAAVIALVAETLSCLGGRPAQPGEFTRRAFLNGRMDLIEAEAVADVVAAETDSQLRQALRQMDGELGATYRNWSERLRTLLAQQEALIDFPDEDLPAEVESRLVLALNSLECEILAHLSDGNRGERLREGLVFVVVGAPNVGKSSLVNALARADVSIVSASPGTTRDALETRLVFGGVPVTLIDTAGLRETADAVEAEGVRRARARAEMADLVIAVSEAAMPDHGTIPSDRTRLAVANKCDLAAVRPGFLPVSARTGEGLDDLRRELALRARAMTDRSGPPPLTRARHRDALTRAAAAIAAAASCSGWPEIRAEELRSAMQSLGRLTGEVSVEAVLDAIFSQFCIGK